MKNNGKIVSINISEKKGTKKKPVETATLIEDHGLSGDAHAGKWHRQVCLLAIESIKTMRAKGLEVSPGDFAENITTEGINLLKVKIGQKISLNENIVLEVTQIGKECLTPCAIGAQVGMCIVPTKGIFAKVIKGGEIKKGDSIKIVES